MEQRVLAMELIPAIRDLLDEFGRSTDPGASDRRAALWRAQQHAAIPSHTIDNLRRFCLGALSSPRQLGDEDPIRGYREGFQAVLQEIRRFETGGPPEGRRAA
jgi:hypothetical protein